MWGFKEISKQPYHRNCRTNPDTNNEFWVWKDGGDLVAYYNKNPRSIGDIKYKKVVNNKVQDITQDYYDFFGLNYNHYHVNEISAELVTLLVMNEEHNYPAQKILKQWYSNNLKNF